MSKTNRTKQIKVDKQVNKPNETRPLQGVYSRLNAFFEKHETSFFFISIILAALLSLLLFDVKVSLSGDDSDYIVNADNFWHHFRFPGFRGPLYPIVLSPFVGLFGINLIVLKSLSALFIILSLWLMYKSFKGIVPAIILMPALLLTSICSFVFFYASHTYSEPMFMLTQALFLRFFSSYFLQRSNASYSLKNDWKKYLILGVLALCMGLTRSIGYGVVGAVALFFIIKRQWKDLLYTVLSITLVFFTFQLLKTAVWPEAGSAYDIKNYLAINYYAPAQGMENLDGFIERLIVNSQVYLSAFLCQMMGIVPETPSNMPEISIWRTGIIYLLYFSGLVLLFKRNTALFFVGIYIGVMNFVSFVLLQVIWQQDRLIMIYYPLIILFLSGGLCYLFQSRKLRKFFFIYPTLILVLCVGTLIITKNRIARNIPVLQQNILGDQLYGLTPDWQNFIKGSRWAAENLDKDASIVSRKVSISKIYTGRDFTGLPSVLIVPADTLNYLKSDTLTPLVIDASKNFISGEALRYIISSQQPIMDINGTKTNSAFIYLIGENEKDEIIRFLRNSRTPYTNDLAAFVKQCKEAASLLRIYDPEMMYRYLIDRKIDYLLLPRLRADPTQKTELFINNIHRYVWCISYKYPDSFKLIKTIGTSEPCEIMQFIH